MSTESVFDKFYREAEDIFTMEEFNSAKGPSRVLWVHRDGRTLLMTGVSERRLPKAIISMVSDQFVKDRVPLDSNVDIYVKR